MRFEVTSGMQYGTAEQMQIPTEVLLEASQPVNALPQQRDFPGALADLMEANKITAQQIETVSSKVWGYFPEGMPLASYPQDYCEYLVANWPGIVDAIKENCPDYVPF